MIYNQHSLAILAPIEEMQNCKVRNKGVTSYGLAETGYDIRIKQAIYFKPYERTVIVIDQQQEETHENTQFTLASSIEKFYMPHNVSGFVFNKSTWARQGLEVLPVVIEPSWRGYLTLNLVYHGSKELYVPAGSGIAQVVFHELSDAVTTYNGKYQNQADEITYARHG